MARVAAAAKDVPEALPPSTNDAGYTVLPPAEADAEAAAENEK